MKEINDPFMSDTVFKHFLKDDYYKYWFYDIIRFKTGIDLNKYELIDNESNTGNNIKDYRMDLVFNNPNNNHKVIIEANNESYNGIAELKSYMYLYRLESDSIAKGSQYNNAHTTLILFNNFLCPEDKCIKVSNKVMMDPVEKIARKDIESWSIYIANYHKMRYNEIEDEIDKRLYILGVKKMDELEKLKKELDPNGENLKIIEEYERLQKENPGFLNLYEYEKDQKRTINTLQYMAREEGSKEKSIEIAKNMLKKEMDIQDIHEITYLSIEEIEKLKNE